MFTFETNKGRWYVVDKKIILASQSPRRRELLALLEEPFQVVSSNVEETFVKGRDLKEQICDLAKRKAHAVFKDHSDAVVISADTIVVYQNQILEKPENEAKAKEMLAMLSGSEHQVWTAFHIISSEREETDLVISNVKFYDLTEEEIDAYVASGEPMDKAGGYNIHGYGALFVESIQGDHFSIMGLPISKVYQLLKKSQW